MKTVLTPEMVAHTWANQTQDNARTQRANFYHNGVTIFSYGSHFPIAKHVTNDNGLNAVLFTTQGYSNTTAKQIGITRSASHHLNIIEVPKVDGDKHLNFEAWQSQIKNIAANLLTARKPEKYIDQINSVYANIVRYATFYGIEIPTSLTEAASLTTKEQYTNYSEAEKLRIAIDKAKALKDREAKIKADLKKWRKGELRSIYNSDYSYLRVNGEDIETSQRIFIPLETAKRFYNVVVSTIAKGGCDNCQMKFMDKFDVLNINKDFITVGCHKIKMSEVTQIAKKLNWLTN